MIPPVRVESDDGPGWPVWVKSDVERFRDEIGRQRAPSEPREPVKPPKRTKRAKTKT